MQVPDRLHPKSEWRSRLIQLFKPFICPEALGAMAEVLSSGYIGDGPVVKQFEEALKPWLGLNLVATNSGTAALWLAYDLADIGPGDYVIASPMSCLATFVPLAHRMATMLWADCHPRTGLIDPHDVERLLKIHGSSVKAIVCVDYGGRVCDLDSLRKLADEYQVWLIEDAAHAFGSFGTGLSHATCYSFQAIKTLTSIEGGALVLNGNSRLGEARMKRWFGLDRTQDGFRCEQTTSHAGYKFNMVDPNAAVGLANLHHMESVLTKQRRHAAKYREHFIGQSSGKSSCWLHTINVKDRESFVAKMSEAGIQCARPHSRCDVHPFLKSITGSLPGVAEFDQQHVAIPVGWWLSEEDVNLVSQEVLKFIQS